MNTQKIKVFIVGVGAAAMAACATAKQGPDNTAPPDLGPTAAADPIGVLAAKTPQREVSVEEREDFDKAMATWMEIKEKGGGSLSSGDCDRAARAFKGAADSNKTLQEARYN